MGRAFGGDGRFQRKQSATRSPAPRAKESQDLVAKLLKMDPRSYDAHRILGEMALLRREPAKAVEELNIANQVKPYQPELVLTLFQAFVQNDHAI